MSDRKISKYRLVTYYHNGEWQWAIVDSQGDCVKSGGGFNTKEDALKAALRALEAFSEYEDEEYMLVEHTVEYNSETKQWQVVRKVAGGSIVVCENIFQSREIAEKAIHDGTVDMSMGIAPSRSSGPGPS